MLNDKNIYLSKIILLIMIVKNYNPQKNKMKNKQPKTFSALTFYFETIFKQIRFDG